MKRMMETAGIRRWLYGLFAWLIPFAVSIPFFGPEGLIIDVFLFKTLIILVGSISAAFLLVSHFKRISCGYIREGMLVGAIWFGVNIGLDLVVLLPLSGQSLPDYFTQIGLRYLVMPINSVMIGFLLEQRAPE